MPEHLSELVDESTYVSESTLKHKSEPICEPDRRIYSKEDTVEESKIQLKNNRLANDF